MTAQPANMRGKICVVSGATRGLGEAAALGLARMGATVVIIGRSRQRIEDTLARLRQASGAADAAGFQADLASQADVRRVAGEILARYPAVDVLINNVGATLLRYQASPDGFEMTWALNYLNHFLMTALLQDGLKRGAALHGEARVVELTSSIYRYASANFEKRQQPPFYNGVAAYAQSKRAVIAYAVEAARRFDGCGVSINAVTPGFVRTTIASGNGWPARMAMWVVARFSVPVEQGVLPILRQAAAPELCGVSGKYYYQDRQMPDDPTCANPRMTARLWHLSEQMTGLS